MRREFILLSLLLCAVVPTSAQAGLSIRGPNVRIGINVPLYPRLVLVPNYPVYYAPELNSNYFFYDGIYWVYQDDSWYASSWYDGPWDLVEPEYVPLFILRIPVRYYRRPPQYFRGWRADAPPRWDEHWGNDWAQHRSGWDQWDRRSVPAPAPPPVYQRQYSGDRYPRQLEQQQTLRNQHYNYQPSDALVRQRFQPERTQNAPAPTPAPTRPATQEDRPARDQRGSTPQVAPRPSPPQDRRSEPRAQPPQRENLPPVQQQRQPREPAEQRSRQPEQAPSRPADQQRRPQNSNDQQKPKQEQDREKDRGNSDEKGDDRGSNRR